MWADIIRRPYARHSGLDLSVRGGRPSRCYYFLPVNILGGTEPARAGIVYRTKGRLNWVGHSRNSEWIRMFHHGSGNQSNTPVNNFAPSHFT